MFSLIIATDNAAFDDAEASETARILRAVADYLESGYLDGKARDANGNTVGEWRLNAAEGLAEHLDGPAADAPALTDDPANIGAGCANSYLADLLDDASTDATNGRALNALHVAALDEAASRIRERATEDEPGDHYGPKA
jgi:hypothetical protein